MSSGGRTLSGVWAGMAHPAAVASSSAALALTLLFSPTGAAHACSQLLCDDVEVGPPAPASLPANVPALYARLNRFYRVDAAYSEDPAAAVRLRDGGGREVPIDLVPAGETGGYWVLPRAKLAPGSYQLGVRSICERTRGHPTTGVLTAPFWKDVDLAIAANSPLPTAAGTLSVKGTRREPRYWSGVESWCQLVPQEVAVVELSFEPSAELVPFQGVARMTLHVDGVLWARSRYGTAEVARTIYEVERSTLEVHAPCEPPSPYANYRPDPGVTEGAHVAELVVELAGGVALPAVPVRFTITCDAGDEEPDAGVADARSPDAAPGMAREGGGGCGVARGPGPPRHLGGALALGLALLVARASARRLA
jgi:hypothetical protein